MTRNKILLLLQATLCVLLAVMLAAAAIGIYRTGAAEKQENPLARIYTRAKVGAALRPVVPVFLLSAAVTVICAVLGVRGEDRDKPVSGGAKPEPPAKPGTGQLTAARLVILAVAAAFIVMGVFNGSMTAVVNKAIRICTECVGLG